MRSLLPLSALLFACTGTIVTPPGGGAGGGTDQQPLGCIGPAELPGAPVPMRRLNRAHVERTVHEVLGVDVPLPVTDEKLFTYKSNVSASVDSQTVQAYFDWAEAVVQQVSLAPCTPERCRSWLLEELAPRFFRRPLEGEQRERYEQLFLDGTAQGRGAETEGAQWVLEALLQSPSFLYLDEPVDEAGYLDGYGVAARLSLMLWGQNPDDTLLGYAGGGRLGTPERVAAIARSMLRDPRSEAGLEAFVSQWLDLERIHQTNARPDLVALGQPLLQAMAREPVDAFRLAVLSGQGLDELLTTPKTPALPVLARYYGADALGPIENGLLQLDPNRRAGLLTAPGVMASLAHADSTSPTLRGYAVLANLMCKPPPPPPAGVNVTLPPPMPNATTRQRLELHFSDDTCGSCHRSMDGMGFAFEHYDALGAWRDTEAMKPIDDTSTFKLGAEQHTVHGAMELSQLLAGRPEVSECFVRQWTRYATGIPEQAPLACFMKELGADVFGPRGLERVIVRMAASDYVRKGNAP